VYRRPLGKTTGPLAAKGVQQLSRVRFEKIDDQGLHISVGSDDSGYQVLQHRGRVRGPEIGPRHRAGSSKAAGVPVHVIGGADIASELDAKRATGQGTRLARSALICDSCLSCC
jgi:2,4-dienoyl-CoA reductase (NADPH2)